MSRRRNGWRHLWTQCVIFIRRDPTLVPNVPESILDGYKNITLCCNLMYTIGVWLLSTISRHILFATGSMIKGRKLKKIEDGTKQVNKMYLQRSLKITPHTCWYLIWTTMARNGLYWHLPQLRIEQGTYNQHWTVKSYRQGTCPIFPSSHAFHADFKINGSPSCCYCYFLNECLYSIQTCHGPVQHKIPQKTCPWNYSTI